MQFFHYFLDLLYRNLYFFYRQFMMTLYDEFKDNKIPMNFGFTKPFSNSQMKIKLRNRLERMIKESIDEI